jgi:hypothetical protein
MGNPKLETSDSISGILIRYIRQVAHNTRYHISTRREALEGALTEINICLGLIQQEEEKKNEEPTLFD